MGGLDTPLEVDTKIGSRHRGLCRSGHGRHADDRRGGLCGPAGLREPGLHLHGHERRSVDGQRGVRRRDELGQGLRAAALRVQHAHRDQHLRVLGRSLLDEELGGLEQVSNNSAAPDSGPELRLLGNQSARVFLERDGGTHQCELIMINDEALVQTNTGNVVCNTSFTNLSDSRVKTEIAGADVAELKQLFDSVEAKQYKRPDMNGT